VEAPHTRGLEPSKVVWHADVDQVVVGRGVVESRYPRQKAGGVVQRARVERQLVCVERARRVGTDDVRAAHALIGDDVDRATQRIGSHPDRHDAAIDLEALDPVHRNGRDAEPETRELDRDAVQKDSDLVACQPMQRQPALRAQTTGALHGHAFGAGQHLTGIGAVAPGVARFDDLDGLC
jgi:hypothetical protein